MLSRGRSFKISFKRSGVKLTRAGEYAVRCVLYLASQGQGELVSRRVVAEYFDIPDKFLAKIAQQLAGAKIIEIRQGAHGGYVLIRDPATLTMLEVVEAIIGKISLNDCVADAETCPSSSNCMVNRVWTKSSDQLRETLAEVTFGGLLKEDSCFIFPEPERLDISRAVKG